MKTLCCSLALAGLLLSGCASKYYDARFAPPTTEAIADLPAKGGQARSVVTFVGVRRKDSKTGAPAQVEFRMRVENLGRIPCTLEQHTLQLLSGKLQPFGAAQPTSDDPPVIVPGANANYEVLFPPTSGQKIDDIDLRSLNLRWGIAFDSEVITNGMTFERIVPVPYESSNFSIGVGFWGH